MFGEVAKTESKRILREPERKARTGLSRIHWWKLEQEGRAPKRIQLSTNAVGWLESEIEEWIAERITKRDTKRTADA